MKPIKWMLIIQIAIIIFLILFIYSEHTSKPKLGFVQTRKILTQYEGIKDAGRDFEVKSKVWKANVDTLFNELVKLRSDLDFEKDELSEKELKAKEELLKVKEDQYYRYKQAVQDKIKKEDEELTTELLGKMNSYIEEYGKTNNYNMIFAATDIGNIVYAQEAYDLTDQIINGLNEDFRKNR